MQEPISDDYIMGFVEGEGCFSITIFVAKRPRKGNTKRTKKLKKTPFYVVPCFRIHLAIKDEKVLRLIKDRIGLGEIFLTKKARKNWSLGAHYYVQGHKEVNKVVAYFKDKTFHSTKGDDFKKWVKCIELINDGKHQSKEGMLEIFKIRDTMNYRPNKAMLSFEKAKEMLDEFRSS